MKLVSEKEINYYFMDPGYDINVSGRVEAERGTFTLLRHNLMLLKESL